MIDVGCNGRISDGGVFSNCSLSRPLAENSLNIPGPKALPHREKLVPHVIVADDAFPLKPYIMKPYPFRDQPLPKRIHNYRLSRARRVVENAFGILANRFRVLRNAILVEPAKAVKIVNAACALHNFLLSTSSRRLYVPPGYADSDQHTGEWRLEGSTPNLISLQVEQSARAFSNNAKDVRTEFEEYFIGEGEVSWQLQHVS